MKESGILALCLTVALAGCRNDGAEAPGLPEGENGRNGVVALDSAQLATVGLERVVVRPLAPDTLHLTGTVTFEPSRVSHVGPRLQGRIRGVMAEVGTPVAEGDTLAVLDSPDLAGAQTSWFNARVAEEVARQNYERVVKLFREGIVSGRRHLEAEAELRQRTSESASAERALLALDARPDSVGSGLFVLRSPLDGIVVEKHGAIGEVASADAELFVVGDIRRVWLLLDLYESDIGRVTTSEPARITTTAYPGRFFTGTVTYVGAIVDSVTRTVKVRVEIPNPDIALKPGMFVHTDLPVDDTAALGIPAVAVQTLDGRQVVFTPAGAGRFRAVEVVPGRKRAGGRIEILAGLAAGDTVVGTGSFALKAHMLRASFGEE